MAWNEPGNGQKDPWNRNRQGGRKPDLDGAIKSVCQVMKADRTKSRLTFYYLLAEHFDKLDTL